MAESWRKGHENSSSTTCGNGYRHGAGVRARLDETSAGAEHPSRSDQGGKGCGARESRSRVYGSLSQGEFSGALCCPVNLVGAERGVVHPADAILRGQRRLRKGGRQGAPEGRAGHVGRARRRVAGEFTGDVGRVSAGHQLQAREVQSGEDTLCRCGDVPSQAGPGGGFCQRHKGLLWRLWKGQCGPGAASCFFNWSSAILAVYPVRPSRP